MCGFLVHYKFTENSKFSKKNFIKSSKLIQHRGPDDTHSFFKKNISMIFYRLSIMDQSIKGRQPMFSQSGRYTIVFNGEIYNAKKLKDKIFNKVKFKGSSDTEVLINLYEIYGEKMLKFLKGMFSFVIYDNKTNKLFTARDRFGIKPLYYFKDKDKLVLCSEIKPLLSYIKNISYEEAAFAKFFFRQELESTENTFFKNIKMHEAAVFKIFTRKKEYSIKYWDIEKNAKLIKNSKKSKINHLSELVENSAREHLNSDVKLSLLLSGGLDSSALCHLISKYHSSNIETFTYDFEDNDLGESKKAKKISNFIGYKNHKVLIKPNYISNNFENICMELESPFTSIRLFGLRKVYQEVNRRGIKVALEGYGGDELLGGYEYNYLSYLLDSYKQNKKKILNYFKKLNNEKILNYIVTLSYQNGSTKDASPFINSELFNKEFLDKNLNEDFFESYKYKKKLNHMQKSQLVDINKVNLPRSLKYMDRLAMNSSVENRVPFLDHKLANFCFNLENPLKIYKNQTRHVMKEIFKKYPVYNFFTKRKKTIVDPQRSWLGKELFEYFFDEINSLEINKIEFFNQKQILLQLENIKKNKLTNSFQLFQILTSIIFIKTFKKKYNINLN